MKTYIIDGVDLVLKDLTLDEAEQVNSLLSFSNNEAEVSGQNSKKFLSIVLEPADKSAEKEINFGKCTEATALEVLKDFFTKRIESGKNLNEYFTTLTEKLRKQPGSMKP